MRPQQLPLKLMTAAVLVATLNACSGISFSVLDFSDDEPKEPVATLADLQPALLPDKDASLPAVDLDTLIATYRDVLAVTDDAAIESQVQHRLAGLEMRRGEQRLFDGGETSGAFDLAIAAYLDLLADNPDYPGNDQLLYQLSKAYDLAGQTEQSMAVLSRLVTNYPNSRHLAEAQFRRAEVFFAAPDYKNAEQSYRAVVSAGDNKHLLNSQYMLGWSLFKQQRYRASLQPFISVLDSNIPADNDLATLSRGKRELTEDVLSVVSIVFSYLDGAASIGEVFTAMGERYYLSLLYYDLGDLYLQQKRYRDSAEAYRAYIDRSPQSDLAPVFYARLINSYVAAGFRDDVLNEKQQYVENYGIYSSYWQQKPVSIRVKITPLLSEYLTELARHYHAQAQGKTKTIAQNIAERENAADQSVKKYSRQKLLGKQELQQLQQSAKQDFISAANYYQQFIDSFPADPKLAEIYFLLAESRFEAGDYRSAIAAYEQVAYQLADSERGAEAAYNVVISYGNLLVALPENIDTAEQLNTIQRQKITSQLRFANAFPKDKHATTVLTKSAEELLSLKEYEQAITAAQQLINTQPLADQRLRKTAWLVVGHSAFELEKFSNAETAYSQTLQLLAQDDETAIDIKQRLAASVYKQAELALADAKPLLAVQQYLRVAEVTPNSSIAVTAQFDAANVLLSIGEYDRAIPVLEQLRRNHSINALSADIPAKLVLAYQQSGQLSAAADELSAIYDNTDDPAIKQESLFQAAELYEQSGDTVTAILRYRNYAHTYPQPFATAMEARFKLSELYLQQQENEKRRFWLRKMIAADADAGSQGNQRSHYLAALSLSVLADDQYRIFSAQSLTLPLKNSLKKKRQSLAKTLQVYQQLADYEIEEFTTLATYRIGEVYGQLSNDLMVSQRPANLDELALEQYDILLEEQAYPFEEKAIDIHRNNAERSWQGSYDPWVQQSFESLKKLLPARYGKEEQGVGFANEIY